MKTVKLITCNDAMKAHILQGVQGKRRFLPPYFVGLQQIN